MVLILIAILAASALAVALVWYGESGYDSLNFWATFSGVLLMIVSVCGLLTYAFLCWNWLASEHKAHIINREYNTNYTQSEMFYASDVIETIKQLNRNRYEINGDLMKQSK